MDKFIYINENSLSPQLCKTIIDKFEKSEKYRGVVSSGVQLKIKNSFDLCLNIEEDNEEWNSIITILKNELNDNILKYTEDFKYLFGKNVLKNYTFQIQKYIKNNGIFNYHHDFIIDLEKKEYRVITFIWYLNDVIEGGETEILHSMKITPTIGKLLLFPACWTFPHSGLTPLSDHKYIITGWLYISI